MATINLADLEGITLAAVQSFDGDWIIGSARFECIPGEVEVLGQRYVQVDVLHNANHYEGTRRTIKASVSYRKA